MFLPRFFRYYFLPRSIIDMQIVSSNQATVEIIFTSFTENIDSSAEIITVESSESGVQKEVDVS